MREILNKNYLGIFEKELIDEIEQVGVHKKVKNDVVLMDIGQNITTIPLLISGAIKIFREDEKGDELLLYFLEKGETCAMTMTGLATTFAKSEIRAITEGDTELIMLPIEKMDDWMRQYKSWREYVIGSYQGRMMEMLETIDKVAFMKMDERLLDYLKERVKITDKPYVQNTHQEIAYDMHTSRVVISRLLKQLERNGLVELSRNKIKLLNL